MITWLGSCPPTWSLLRCSLPSSLSSLLLVQHATSVSAPGPLHLLYILPRMLFSHLRHGSFDHFIQGLQINLFKKTAFLVTI